MAIIETATVSTSVYINFCYCIKSKEDYILMKVEEQYDRALKSGPNRIHIYVWIDLLGKEATSLSIPIPRRMIVDGNLHACSSIHGQ
jgi:hypothetical protein